MLTEEQAIYRWVVLRRYLNMNSPLTRKECSRFVDWMLDEESIAKRPGKRGKRQKNPMRGRYINIQGKIRHVRGSDFRLRLYITFEAWKKVGYTIKQACLTLAELPAVKARLGRSKRGQRQKGGDTPEILCIAETIRSLCIKFNAPFKQQLLDDWLAHFRRFEAMSARPRRYRRR